MGPIADEIRAAIASGEFVKAGELWTLYAGRMRRAIEAGSVKPAELEEARQLLADAQTAVKCVGAHAHARIAEARGAMAYSRQARPELGLRKLL
jgi:hypothetical protein